MGKDIYWNGKIYKDVQFPVFQDWRYGLVGIEVLNPPASWEDGDCVSGMYELQHQINSHNVGYYKASKGTYDLFIGEKRIMALPNTLREDNESDVGREAKVLVDKFRTELYEFEVMDGVTGRRAEKAAKQCALICVDKIIKAIDFDWMEIQNLDRQHAYWTAIREAVKNI